MMPIIVEDTIAVARRTQTGEIILDVFPSARAYGVSPIRTPHVEAADLPTALRQLADLIEKDESR